MITDFKGVDNMKFNIKDTKNKTSSINKSLYISTDLVDKVNKIAEEYNTSFNNVVVSMIEYCLEDEKQKA